MGRKASEILEQARRSPANVRYQDLCKLVEALGYVKRRQAGSYRVFSTRGGPACPW